MYVTRRTCDRMHAENTFIIILLRFANTFKYCAGKKVSSNNYKTTLTFFTVLPGEGSDTFTSSHLSRLTANASIFAGCRFTEVTLEYEQYIYTIIANSVVNNV